MKRDESIIYQTDSGYDHYEVVERTYEGRSARVLFSGPRRAAQSGIGLDDDPDLLFDYNQRILELANGLYPTRILVIGGGAFTLPMALVAALPDAQVDVVELDPGLKSIAEQYFGLQQSERLEIMFGDGREFVQTTTNTYDLIIMDVFSELRIPQQFLTVNYVQLLSTKLNPGGAVAMNIIASYQGRNTALIKSQVAAYTECFDRLDIYPAAHGLTSWLPQNLILLAQLEPMRVMHEYVRFAPITTIMADADDMYHDAAQ